MSGASFELSLKERARRIAECCIEEPEWITVHDDRAGDLFTRMVSFAQENGRERIDLTYRERKSELDVSGSVFSPGRRGFGEGVALDGAVIAAMHGASERALFEVLQDRADLALRVMCRGDSGPSGIAAAAIRALTYGVIETGAPEDAPVWLRLHSSTNGEPALGRLLEPCWEKSGGAFVLAAGPLRFTASQNDGASRIVATFVFTSSPIPDDERVLHFRGGKEANMLFAALAGRA